MPFLTKVLLAEPCDVQVSASGVEGSKVIGTIKSLSRKKPRLTTMVNLWVRNRQFSWRKSPVCLKLPNHVYIDCVKKDGEISSRNMLDTLNYLDTEIVLGGCQLPTSVFNLV